MPEFSLHERLARDCITIRDLDLCRLLLMNNSDFPWCILVPRRAGIREIHELAEDDQQQLMRESSALSKAMLALFGGDKMNVAVLGNVVPQLHLHHIVRRSADKAWPDPVWGRAPGPPYSEAQLADLRRQLQAPGKDSKGE
ncbi:MAG: HIT family protein [Pseudohongiellaceae bacterium]